MITRKNQSKLSNKEWDQLICAMKELKKDKGNRNWDYFQDIHKKYGNHDHESMPHVGGEHLTIHDSYYWLPWHRKLLMEFEERLRDFESSVSIPYWNWVTFREIPEEFGKKLFGWMHVTRAVSHNGDKLPTKSEYEKATKATEYSTFDSEMLDLHADIHSWVGGEMSNPAKSCNDPLFFLHHAFIDKTWSDWAARNPKDAFPSDYLKFKLVPWSTTVQEVLTISSLNYKYQ